MLNPSTRRLALAATVVALSLAGGAVTVWNLGLPTGAPVISVSIEEGMSARAIGTRLEALGLIHDARLFEATARLRGVASRLEAGHYRLDGSRSLAELLENLLEAPLEMVRVTIPEGLDRMRTAAIFQAAGLADSARFVAVTEATELVADLGLSVPSVEGYLFPETYFLPPDVTEEEIVRHMVAEFFHVFEDTLFDRLQNVGLSLHQAVTLASIVEREAVVAVERPIISAIFLRRLNLNRRLESCATVEFALGVHKKRLTNRDLQVVSPYNTYRHRGLPPGPIGSPGKASLLAAVYPVETEFLYFVARGDGTHTFSRTNREHEVAKRRIRAASRVTAGTTAFN